jgi:hypothetical protein
VIELGCGTLCAKMGAKMVVATGEIYVCMYVCSGTHSLRQDGSKDGHSYWVDIHVCVKSSYKEMNINFQT